MPAQANYNGTLEDALEEANQLDTINALSEEELQESIEFGQQDINEMFANTDNSKILFSPQIEVFEPWAAHVDASRTNMSAKQLLQTVTSDNNETPFVINKNYQAMTGINSPFIEYADEDGVVLYSGNNYLSIFYTTTNVFKNVYCPPIKRMTNNTITLKFKMSQAKPHFKKGSVLFDYTGQTQDSNVPKIGYRTSIMYGSFYGYTADDAFVMSESYAERTKIDYSKKIFIPITKELKYLKNASGTYFSKIGEISDSNYLEYFKIDASDSMLSEFNNTSKTQSKIYGKAVDSIDGGTILDFKVHILNDKTFDELEEEYIYTEGMIHEIKLQFERQLEIKKDMFLNYSKVFTNSKLAAEKAEEVFSQWESMTKASNAWLEAIADDYRIDKEKIDYVLEIEIYKSEPTCLGDKFANVFAGKGVVSLILPDHLMPKDEFDKPADIIFNPLGLFGRNNWGTIFEIGTAKIIRDVERHIEDKMKVISRIEFIRLNFIELFDKEYSQKMLDVLYSWEDDEEYSKFKDSVKENGFYLLVDNFPGVSFKDFTDNFLIKYEEKYEINITQKTETCYSKELMQYMRDRGFVSNVFGASVVQEVKQNVYFGQNYWIKLFHTSNSKYNAISFANNYSKSTGEPPRGRTKGGGCHISWQSTAALIGHKEGNPCSIELRTIKSDAVQDKNNFNRKMVKDGFYVMKDKYKSPTVNTLNNGLNMLCLQFSSIHDNNSATSFGDYSEEVFEEDDVEMSELFTGKTVDYERQDNLSLEIDEDEQRMQNVSKVKADIDGAETCSIVAEPEKISEIVEHDLEEHGSVPLNIQEILDENDANTESKFTPEDESGCKRKDTCEYEEHCIVDPDEIDSDVII